MSAFADMSLKNNIAAEVAFSRVGRDMNDVFKWRALSISGDVKRQHYVTASMKPINASTKVARSTIKVAVPITDAATNVVGEAICTVQFAIPVDLTTAANRGDLLGYVADALSTETPIRNMILGLEGIY